MKKLDKYKKIVKRIRRMSELKQFGFKRKSTGGLTGEIYVHPKQKVVIKANYICSGKTPKIAIPTVIVVNNKVGSGGEGDGRILIQPIANVSNKSVKKAMNLLETTLSYREYNYIEEEFDFHTGNVALYNGRAVLIDW